VFYYIFYSIYIFFKFILNFMELHIFIYFSKMYRLKFIARIFIMLEEDK